MVLKNSDACGAAITAATTLLTPTNTVLADLQQGANGYVLQVNVSSFSSFYFAASNVTLPLDLLTFTGALQSNNTTLLKWKTENEINASHFVIERSGDGNNYTGIGSVTAVGNSINVSNYTFTDK